MKLTELTVEYKSAPLGLDCQQPRFCWKLADALPDTLQTAWRVMVKAEASDTILWDSGRVESSQSVYIEYLGPNLAPCTAYRWAVMVWDNHGNRADAESRWETGLLSGEAFAGKAEWITNPPQDEANQAVPPVFTRTFTPAGVVASARLYATALGVYEVTLNGGKLGDACLAPGWTNYRKRLQYQSYAIETLCPGENRLSFTVGSGWYRGMLGFDPTPNHYGTRAALLALLVLRYADGREETIGTAADGSWQTSTGPIRFSEIYDGEIQDFTLREEKPAPAQRFDYGYETLVGQENEPVRCLARLDAARRFTTPKGELVYDFGQNLTGWVELEITGTHGQKLALRHGESLDAEGNFYTENLSFAKATDTYILSGKAQTLRPHFTFHGFRYLCVEGLAEGQQATFTACHLSTDLAQTGQFTCSDERVNRLQENIQWGQRDNFLDVPTDCPQRSERLGWTGDVTAFCPTAAFNENLLPFMTKWLRDLASEQNAETGMPQVVPNVLGDSQPGAAFWGDVATVLPWELYRAYGDKRVLAEQYESMKLWIDFVHSQCGENGLWQTGYQYGDWLGLDTEGNDIADTRKGATDDYFAANACYAQSLQIVAETARLLGCPEESRRYADRHEKLIQNFQAEYVTQNGRLASETQTAMVLALRMGLVPSAQRPALADRLAANIVAHKNHLVTGFIGTPYACPALSDHGHHALAGKLLLQEENPGWLYEVKMGATTIWERWDSIRPDGSFNPENMNSLNHYAYGSIGDWLYTRLAGLQILEPGYKKFALTPRFIEGITWVRLRYESVYGTIRVEWRCEHGTITVEAEIPANTTAVLTLPEQEGAFSLGSGVYHYEYSTNTVLEKARYTLETPLHVVMHHPVARAIFAEQVPELLDNKMMEYVMKEPLSALLSYTPEMKPLFEAVVAAMCAAEAEGGGING